MSPKPRLQAVDESDAALLAGKIDREAGETTALLGLVKVLCNLEQRDAHAMVDGTLADAAEGLAVLMDDLGDRVEAMQGNAEKLFAAYRRAARVGVETNDDPDGAA